MGGKRKALPWRRAFLRALARTGNVRLAAEAAGVDYTTAYALRKRDKRFAGAWERALERARGPVDNPRSGPQIVPSPPRRGQVVRVSKTHGAQVVRVAEGRWSEGKEKAFFAALFDTGNVRAAARAVGMSTTAIYNRRRTSDGFAEAWAAVLSEGKVQLEMNMVGAVNRALDSIDPAEPPEVTMKDAVAVFSACRDKGESGRGGPHGRYMPRIASNEEVRAALAKSLRAFGERVTKEEEAGDRGGGA